MKRKYTEKELAWARQFGDRIKRLIHIKGMTQKQVACELGIDESVLSKYVNGKHIPNMYTVWRIINILGCDANTLYDKNF